MDNVKLRIGEVVRLKSGGPLMTVSDAENESGHVGCRWFAECLSSAFVAHVSKRFDVASLDIVPQQPKKIDPKPVFVIFDGPPGPESGRFVEVEDAGGCSVKTDAEWEERDGGLWSLGPLYGFDCPGIETQPPPQVDGPPLPTGE